MTSEPTGFLYPFIEAEERNATALLADLASSAQAKMAESRAMRATTIERCAGMVAEAGRAMAQCFSGGGRLFAFGNGGSSTDAEGAVELFRNPPSGLPLPALSLVDDRAVLTALANDIGFDVVFSRQIIAHGHPGDIAVGFSTSGDSRNVLRALDEASKRGLLTVGLSGYQGGAMAASDALAHCLVVCSDSVHRIQESQDTLVLELWLAVQRFLGQEVTA
ncbi:MAG: SIS domain-containing protein [Acidimicrobiales bacterium]